ncbi:MAG TPA: DUF948 domain-containing protein [Candidatus Polarisedimenticolia bacterium]|nr:DUF948 domain-containing protein [Candidatus Polarisedimenticolia bacterium]
MNISAPMIAVGLFAILVAAAIPVLYQLHRTLKNARAVLESAGPRLEKAIEQVGQAADRLNEVGQTLQEQAQALRPLLNAVSGVGRSIDRTWKWLGAAMSFGGAIGPAVIAGVHALYSETTDPPPAGKLPARLSGKANGSDDQQSTPILRGDIS